MSDLGLPSSGAEGNELACNKPIWHFPADACQTLPSESIDLNFEKPNADRPIAALCNTARLQLYGPHRYIPLRLFRSAFRAVEGA